MVSNTKPFFAALLSFCFMKELLSKVEIGFMVLSFLGIILISFSKQLEGDDTDIIVSEAKESKWGYLIGVMCISTMAVAAATVGVLTRKMQKLPAHQVLAFY